MGIAKDKWNEVIGATVKNEYIKLAPYYSTIINHDIKHLNFILSRYKFATKMIENRKKINLLELGCSYGLGSQFFLQTNFCKNFVGVDFDREAIKWAKATFKNEGIEFVEDDFLNKDYCDVIGGEKFDVIVSLDVLEHIEKKYEVCFLKTIELNLKDNGFVIIGTPNITMSPYASKGSRIGHVNLYDQESLYDFLSEKFHNVFIFGMNDEVVHTGFYPMSCYIMAICSCKK